MPLTIIIPSYNESASLPGLLPGLRSFANEHGFKVIIVNDGSTDNTRLVTQEYEDDTISTVHHKLNRGYGSAIKTGMRMATTPYLITMDADGQHRLEDVLTLYNSMVESNADMIIGGRFNQKNASLMRGIGKNVIRIFVKFLIKVPVFDINSGMKIYNSDLARRYLRLAPDYMAFSDVMTIIFVQFRCRVLEVPIRVNERVAGKSTINYKTGFETLKEIVFIATVFVPYRFFSLLAIITLLVTLSWGLPFIISGKGFTAATAIGILAALLLWSLGVIAQLISGIRKDLILQSSGT